MVLLALVAAAFAGTGTPLPGARAAIDGPGLAPNQVTGQPPERVDAVAERSAQIRGRVLDEDGSPLAGAKIEALRVSLERGARAFTPVATASSDDRGRFTLPGLTAGRYVVSAIHTVCADDRGASGCAPTYYPGADTPDAASPVHAVAPGSEDVPAIEFRVRILRPARVSGRLLTPDRRPLLGAAVIMSPQVDNPSAARAVGQARIYPDGRFAFSGVPPGRYVIRARGETDRRGSPLFATFAMAVQGRDVDRIDLTLTPGASLEGRVEAEARHGSPPPRFASLRVRVPLADGSSFGDTLAGQVQADGAFRVAGIMPGTHVLMVEGLPFPWRIAEARVQRHDAVEHALEIESDAAIRIPRVLLTDTAAGVIGTVPLAGLAASDVRVVAFPVDPLQWTLPLRFVRVAPVALEGDFRILGLPADDYLIAAMRGVTDADAIRRETLGRIAGAATRVRLAEGQISTVRLSAPAAAAGLVP